MTWLSYPPILSRSSEHRGKSHVSPFSLPSFLEAARFPLSLQNSDVPMTWFSKERGSSSAGQPFLQHFTVMGIAPAVSSSLCNSKALRYLCKPRASGAWTLARVSSTLRLNLDPLNFQCTYLSFPCDYLPVPKASQMRGVAIVKTVCCDGVTWLKEHKVSKEIIVHCPVGESKNKPKPEHTYIWQ